MDLRCVVQHGEAGTTYEQQIGLLRRQTELKDEELFLSELVKSLGQHMVLIATSISDTSSPNQQLTDLWLELRGKIQQREKLVIIVSLNIMTCDLSQHFSCQHSKNRLMN